MAANEFSGGTKALAATDRAHPAYPAVVYLASLAPGGRGGVAGVLRRVAALRGRAVEAVDWAALRYPDVLDVRRRLVEAGAAPATANLTLAALRGVARAPWSASSPDWRRSSTPPTISSWRCAPPGRGGFPHCACPAVGAEW